MNQKIEEFTEQVDMRPFHDATSAFLAMWRNALLDAANYLAGVWQTLADVLCETANVIQEAIERVEKRDRERSKWRRFNAPKPRILLLDKRSKVHRCRNAC